MNDRAGFCYMESHPPIEDSAADDEQNKHDDLQDEAGDDNIVGN
jgi:hypothetical protein